MGVAFEHLGVVRETEKSRLIKARIFAKSPSHHLEVDQEIWVPKSLTAKITKEIVEVRTWFFNKALKHMHSFDEAGNGIGFIMVEA